MPTYDSSMNVALMSDATFKKPTSFKTFPKMKTTNVIQDVVYKSGGTFFISQGPGVTGQAGIFTTIINRLSLSDGSLLDSMELTYGGHGLGFEIEYDSNGKTYVWMTWQGQDESNDFIRFQYRPGVFTRAQVNAFGDTKKIGVQDPKEAVYHFDWYNGLAIERHYNWDGTGETYKVRGINDLSSGIDNVLHKFQMRADGPTVQGFAIMQGAMFRYLGKAYDNNTPVSGDPIKIEQVRWNDYAANFTGYATVLGSRTYNTSVDTAIHSNGGSGSSPTWAGNHFEPEGMSVFRESSGASSLIIGDTVGSGSTREYRVSKFSEVGGPTAIG